MGCEVRGAIIYTSHSLHYIKLPPQKVIYVMHLLRLYSALKISFENNQEYLELASISEAFSLDIKMEFK